MPTMNLRRCIMMVIRSKSFHDAPNSRRHGLNDPMQTVVGRAHPTNLGLGRPVQRSAEPPRRGISFAFPHNMGNIHVSQENSV